LFQADVTTAKMDMLNKVSFQILTERKRLFK